jgi:hypothetical protein
MARIDIPDGEGVEMRRLWQLAPHLGVGVGALGKACYVDSSLSAREREVARFRIAQFNECDI